MRVGMEEPVVHDLRHEALGQALAQLRRIKAHSAQGGNVVDHGALDEVHDQHVVGTEVRIRARAFHSRLIVEKLAEPHEIVLLDAEVKLLARRALQLGDQVVQRQLDAVGCTGEPYERNRLADEREILRHLRLSGDQKLRQPLEKTCLNDGVSHRYGAWVTTTAATVFSPETQVTTCELCGKKQYRQAGSALAPTMQVNTEKITLKTGQATTGFRVSDLAAGDSVASYTSSNTKIFTVNGSGKLTAKKKTGSAKLTITLASGYSRTVTVKVQKAAVKTTKITGLQRS